MFEKLSKYIDARKDEKAVKKEVKREAYIAECTAEENRRWGAPVAGAKHDYDDEGRNTRAVVHRYQQVVGIAHLTDARINKKYLRNLQAGYFEPIPVAWANRAYNPLTGPAVSYGFDDAAEERLYWCLNNSIDLDAQGRVKPKQQTMKPSEWAEMAMAQKRMNTQVPIDTRFASEGDYFRQDKTYARQGYSRQVPALHISSAFNELFENQARDRALGGQGHHTDEIDVMILIDVSSSMGWVHPYGFSQPKHVDVVHNILKRAIHHMEVRDPYASSGGGGVETICFNSYGHKLGKINWNNFDSKWAKISDLVYRGGATQVMTGWQLIKETHFAKHGGEGKSWRDPTYGLQATKAMAKLSLLVLLDGEARDMDEFELDLLGEKWCYVTVCLIGKENCPDHHRHANELTRIAHANDHVQFYDCHGRICERLVVSDVLQRVYASTAPSYEEIMDPKYDLGGVGGPPAYKVVS